jgi:hypothetical protein
VADGDVLTKVAGHQAFATPTAQRAASSTTPSPIGTAAIGTAATDARADHVHATGAGTPSTQAFGDSAVVGTGPAAAMSNHKHAMPAVPTASQIPVSPAVAGASDVQGVLEALALMRVKTTHLDTAQLTDWKFNPPVLVAGVTGKIIVPLSAPFVALHVPTTAFESLADAVEIGLNSDELGFSPIFSMGLGEWGNGGPNFYWLMSAYAYPTGATTLGGDPSYTGQPLVLRGNSSITAGDGNADITVVYYLADPGTAAEAPP